MRPIAQHFAALAKQLARFHIADRQILVIA